MEIFHSLEEKKFLKAMEKVAVESYRVLKKGKMCAVMMGDIRKHGKVIPLGFRVMECFLKAGFHNQEIIIKEQHNCRSSKYWENKEIPFLLLAHEYIFVFKSKIQVFIVISDISIYNVYRY